MQTWAICSVLSADVLANVDLDHKEQRFSFCIQELLPVALSDGDFPMRNMGATTYDNSKESHVDILLRAGGRNYSKCVLPPSPRYPCALPTVIPPPSYVIPVQIRRVREHDEALPQVFCSELLRAVPAAGVVTALLAAHAASRQELADASAARV